MAHSKTSKARIKAAERRIKALELRKQGYTYREIGEKIGCGESRAHQIITKELCKINDTLDELRPEVVRLELERLDKMMPAFSIKAERGDAQAGAMVIKIMDRRSKFQGNDAPTRIEQTGDAVFTVKLPDMGDADGGEDGEGEVADQAT